MQSSKGRSQEVSVCGHVPSGMPHGFASALCEVKNQGHHKNKDPGPPCQSKKERENRFGLLLNEHGDTW